jgi:hypothetical protein
LERRNIKMKKTQFFLIVLLAAVAASNALAEMPDAYTLAWTDFKLKNKDLLNVQSPDTYFQAKNNNTGLGEQHLFAQTQAAEKMIQIKALRKTRPYRALTRPRGNPAIRLAEIFLSSSTKSTTSPCKAILPTRPAG